MNLVKMLSFRLENAKKKIQKKFFVDYIFPSELVALNCLY